MRPIDDSMRPTRVLLDLLAGFAAILCVVGSAIVAQFVGSDLRVMFAVAGIAFFLAGLARGSSGPASVWVKGILTSSPGILGDVALILNDGFHRIGIPIAITIASILLATAGAQTRRLWAGARRRGWLLGASSLAGLVLLVPFGVPAIATLSSLRHSEDSAVSFSMTRPDGTVLDSGELQGRTVVLAFWATWCLPCRWELPAIEQLWKRYEANPQVVILAVDAEMGDETPRAAREFLARGKLEVPWASDTGGAGRALGVDSLPTVIVLDRDGHVRMKHYGYDASERLESLISDGVDRLLAGGHP